MTMITTPKGKPIPAAHRKIVVGTRVRLRGQEGWWTVTTLDGNVRSYGHVLSCKQRQKNGSKSQIWTVIGQVIAVRNPTKRKEKG